MLSINLKDKVIPTDKKDHRLMINWQKRKLYLIFSVRNMKILSSTFIILLDIWIYLIIWFLILPILTVIIWND